jgi:hypothetical protein
MRIVGSGAGKGVVVAIAGVVGRIGREEPRAW